MEQVVKKIISDVKKTGDTAVIKYTKKFDGAKLESLRIPRQEIRASYNKITPKQLKALKEAAKNIRQFAIRQKNSLKGFTFQGRYATIKQRLLPVESVGCYVPGGKFPLASTALMTVMTAEVAGCKNIIVCTPRPSAEIIAASDLSGANQIFAVGGVQAIAAMAYGTRSIPKVNMIVGPGNKWVTAAKKEVYGDVGIDLLAGPSELVVIADSSGNPETISSELLAQKEHGNDSLAFFITNSGALAGKVKKKVTGKAGVIKVTNLETACNKTNNISPEHLYMEVKNPEKLIRLLKNFGTLVIGPHGSVVFSDYGIGPNHTLPTGGSSKFQSGLSVLNFLRIQTIQRSSKKSSRLYADTASTLARVEGLIHHATSSNLRKTLH